MPKTTAPEFDAKTQENIVHWLHGHYDEKTKLEVREMVEKKPLEAIDAFYTNLEFGTGGLRGIMGVGSNRMNYYTVRTATQGLANYINSKVANGSVFISYDSRHHSKEFAEEAAKVLAGNGIHAYLTKDLRPTPLVSFGCRYKNCTSAIMITASHNPPEYNGYKVYWSDGGQVLPPNDVGIIDEVNKITDVNHIKSVDSVQNALITYVGEEVDQAYLAAISTLQIHPAMNLKNGHNLSVVYTSLHGTGITLVPEALKQCGFTNLHYVDDQIIPNGDFPTARYPNPEDRNALTLGIKKLEAVQGDLLIATDPDADRVGIAVRHKGETVLLTGNQVACLCVDYICQALEEQGKLPPRAAFIKSIVTSELFNEICKHYKRTCVEVLTGFKYIAEKIREWERNEKKGLQFLFGAEESYGYLLGTFSRDKDAVVSSALICELALWCKMHNKTLVDQLHELYRQHGVYNQKLYTINFEDTKEGKEKMSAGMQKLRDNPPTILDGELVVKIEDYQTGISNNVTEKKESLIELPKSNVISFHLEDRSKITIRPSGTEPKIKIYCEVVMKKFVDISGGINQATHKADQLITALKELF